MAYLTPEQENKRLRICSWISVVLVIVTLSLLNISCKPKPAQTTSRPAQAPQVDSFRIDLEQQRDSAQTKATVSSQHSQTAVTQYEKDKESFDGIRVVLP